MADLNSVREFFKHTNERFIGTEEAAAFICYHLDQSSDEDLYLSRLVELLNEHPTLKTSTSTMLAGIRLLKSSSVISTIRRKRDKGRPPELLIPLNRDIIAEFSALWQSR